MAIYTFIIVAFNLYNLIILNEFYPKNQEYFKISLIVKLGIQILNLITIQNLSLIFIINF